MIPIATAVPDAAREAELVAALASADSAVTVVRRCVELADLLAVAAAGTVRAVLVGAGLRGLDRDALARLALAGVAVVGVARAGDESAERSLRQLGISSVLLPDAPAGEAAELVCAVVEEPAPPVGYVDPRRADVQSLQQAECPDEPEEATGCLVAVWGPTGAPGRTTVAVTLAAELAAAGRSALLVDADPYGGTVAPALGLLDEAPGVLAAVRAANAGSLDVPGLARVARALDGGLRVLTGLPRADRWPELRPAALEAVLALARRLVEFTVVDVGFALEQDEELAFDTAAPRRNAATLVALGAADRLVAVGAADPIGLQRLVRGLAELREVVPGAPPVVVVNRVRRGVVPGDPSREVRAALERYAGAADPVLVPYDRAGCDAALATGRTLLEQAPASPARRALLEVAHRVAGIPATPPRRRMLARRLRPERQAARRSA